jgi:hypothetical protein
MSSTTTSLDVSCCACDYVLSHEHFAQGQGRIMFSAGWGITEGDHRCGHCDDRCSEGCGDCDYCGSFDYNCEGCDECCWCGGSGNIHQGCGCHDESSQSGLVTSETGTLGSDSEKFDEKIPLLSGIINQTTMASSATSLDVSSVRALGVPAPALRALAALVQELEDRLQAENAQLKAEIARLQSAAVPRRTTRSDTEIARLQADNTRLQDENAGLKVCVGGLQIVLRGLERDAAATDTDDDEWDWDSEGIWNYTTPTGIEAVVADMDGAYIVVTDDWWVGNEDASDDKIRANSIGTLTQVEEPEDDDDDIMGVFTPNMDRLASK